MSHMGFSLLKSEPWYGLEPAWGSRLVEFLTWILGFCNCQAYQAGRIILLYRPQSGTSRLQYFLPVAYQTLCSPFESVSTSHWSSVVFILTIQWSIRPLVVLVSTSQWPIRLSLVLVSTSLYGLSNPQQSWYRPPSGPSHPH